VGCKNAAELNKMSGHELSYAILSQPTYKYARWRWYRLHVCKKKHL